jgi:hypothetical protein
VDNFPKQPKCRRGLRTFPFDGDRLHLQPVEQLTTSRCAFVAVLGPLEYR